MRFEDAFRDRPEARFPRTEEIGRSIIHETMLDLPISSVLGNSIVGDLSRNLVINTNHQVGRNPLFVDGPKYPIVDEEINIRAAKIFHGSSRFTIISIEVISSHDPERRDHGRFRILEAAAYPWGLLEIGICSDRHRSVPLMLENRSTKDASELEILLLRQRTNLLGRFIQEFLGPRGIF